MSKNIDNISCTLFLYKFCYFNSFEEITDGRKTSLQIIQKW